MRVLVLGSAAGGGFPQWNCRCPVCRLAWAGDKRVTPRTQSSLAVSADGVRWLLLNASPDLRQQILANTAVQPQEGNRHSPIAGVFLTNGDIDHLAGLLTLREQQAFTIFGTGATLAEIAAGSVFGVLNKDLVSTQKIALDVPCDTGLGLTVTAFAVPGKVPLYLEGEKVQIGELSESTLGLEITDGAKRFFYIPGCAAVTDQVIARIKGADLLFFDGTTFTDREMVDLGLSQKTAWRMGHVAMSGEEGSLRRLADCGIGRKIYIHINNTNPVLIDDSPERASVEKAGWQVAYDGMEVVA
ncbi:pyrroloquinoline quinone biosynthesis protein PqqB [Beijerinckia indica]|uniref:Coenzyme PQQ synthesis protein B n=1 Tax=Beijerinckia indica subsp. indica (strain ATCC 9039 / DSM 1715 / NCIMB 8712) TaxID=395963 RepID=B2IDU9_BEII9|nr:pyrroloquinoline quinone biosynthesis protein PqqB [Beijerinckia indica]ACB96881.1 coenzyme PQQ biosynthesis protein B [Beijerinckia indica subsp. indica ATCC 9039]